MMVKTSLPKRQAEKTRQEVTRCPVCHNGELIKNYKRDETYCNHCGIVLSQAVKWDGGVKTENILPYSVPFSARNGIHTNWIHYDDKGKFANGGTTRYRHNFSDEKIMRLGRGRRLRPL